MPIKIHSKTVSVFETPVARFSTAALVRCAADKGDVWQVGQIDPDDVRRNLASARPHLIEPGVYTDDDEDDHKNNIGDCSRADHIARIAWFVKHWNEEQAGCLSGRFHTGKGDYLEVADGFHRIFAASIANVESLRLRLLSGQTERIELQDGFEGWETQPPQAKFFGDNRFCVGDQVFGILVCSLTARIWIDNQDGETIVRAKLNGQSMVDIGGSVKLTKWSPQQLLRNIAKRYPEFKEFPEKVFLQLFRS